MSYAVSANWLEQSTIPTQQQLDNFLIGHGFSVGGAYFLGEQMSYTPGAGRSWGVVFGTPQVGASYNYTPSSDTYNGSVLP